MNRHRLLCVFAALATSVSNGVARAQTSQPASAPARKPYDPWTSKTLTGDWGGVRTTMEDAGISLKLFYNQQYQQNFRGGLETNNGHRLSGSYDFVPELDFGKMGLIPNASFFMEAKGTWSDGINPDKVGALFNVNSDAGDDHALFIKKWWYKQFLLDKKIELRLGMLESNKDLVDVSLYANHEDKDFLNRLSIRDGTIPHRTGLGAYLKLQPVDWFYFQALTLDAQNHDRQTGFNTAFHDERWFMGYWEAGFTPKWQTDRGPLPGRYRIGWWYDPRSKQVFENSLGGRKQPNHRGDDVGFYLGFDQMVWKEQSDPKDTQGLGVFARYGLAHGDVNKIDRSWQAGASYAGLVPTRDRDVAAFSVSQAILSDRYHDEVDHFADRETVYEWYYLIEVTPWCLITPDFQVITNPGGGKNDRDAIVGGVRIRIIF